jgi:uncharacterized protein YehS (DUF1456 family)
MISNNEILRRLRFTFDFKDHQMVEILAIAGKRLEIEEVAGWLKREDNEEYATMEDIDLAYFFNGFITLRRGKKPGLHPAPEKVMNNNLVYIKLKIALKLKDTDIVELMKTAGYKIGKHDLSAFIRNPSLPQYRICHDHFIRNFLHSIDVKYRVIKPEAEVDEEEEYEKKRK